jgi:formylglycine-generating enzyme required for sulfatase activity
MIRAHSLPNLKPTPIANLFGRLGFRIMTAAILFAAFQGMALCSPSRGEDLASGQPARHLVFAHYMLCYTKDLSFCKREIELAQSHGIDGFALNAGDWRRTDGTPTEYVEAADRVYQAAKELNTGFKLFLSADATGPASRPDNQCDMVRRYASHPNQLHQDGKTVFSAWSGTPEIYRPALEQLKAEGIPVFFVPYISYSPFPMNLSERTVRSYFDGNAFMDGYFYFAVDEPIADMIQSNATACRVIHELGKLYMAGLAPAYNSANLRDFRGMEGYGAVWRGIIQDNADWVEIVTWNDYNEDSNLMPSRGCNPPSSEAYLFSRDDSFLDVTGFYVNWFKSGERPKITQDKIYYVYRNRSKYLTKAWDYKENKWLDITLEGGSTNSLDQFHDDVEDNIYVTTFLTEPADLVISVGAQEQKFQMPAGIGYAALPIHAGVPHFELLRAGKPLLEVDGRKEIIGEATQENSVDGGHALNRTWTGGAAVGPIIELKAQTGALEGKAVKQGRGVQIPTENGSGFKLSVNGLKKGTYNVRVVYRNPARGEARLSLFADGPTEEKNANFIPLFLPPTGDSTKTTSFLWSLYDTTTELTVRCQIPEPPKPSEPPLHPWTSDCGGVQIDTVEIVPVDGTSLGKPLLKKFPEMVNIQGGSFQMGGEEGKPDEKPVRNVTLSPFAIGKYDITNEEYEQFDPEHRQLRDAYSWRPRDPVIYISWQQAARYCNWLSAQAAFEPFYDEHSGKINLTANGYRLPSEAQWEYVASGRGEGRKYPWGNEEPTAERGNFLLHASMDIERALLGQFQGSTTPVGSYEKGASRDGVMDMAGNVAQWCSDVYAPYASVEAKDPLNEQGSQYKTIRGGSWGYYNYSQRVTAREFNTSIYPGFVYIGMRVALPKPGGDKKAASVK